MLNCQSSDFRRTVIAPPQILRVAEKAVGHAPEEKEQKKKRQVRLWENILLPTSLFVIEKPLICVELQYTVLVRLTTVVTSGLIGHISFSHLYR